MTDSVLQQLAFTARSRDEVEEFVGWARTNGVALRSVPRSYPEYGGDYHAVFFDGPEGLRLELVHLSEP